MAMIAYRKVVEYRTRNAMSLGCVSKSQGMQFRAKLAAFQGDFPQAYWLQVKGKQHRKAAKSAENALRGF